ncbi:hypothetical protein IT084_15715 [Desulfallas sp. Bu1-1]|uniref:cobaltochelatase CobT-related protein n=1 Tax=Desulfallas sp. Bu1-1 TaxID=2787620 RepID=UPI00189EB40B|nr:hypothetical protein [Desulfallas sp. Bu1-1]MBF7084400.1 hypothetical protein [Desulfallas sp. Bu1-1]
MSQIELKRARLQALARVLSARGKLTLMFGDTPCTDLKNIILRLTEGEIVPGVPATGAECWIAMKASVAHESAHIRFTSKSAWDQATRHSRLMAHLVNIIEDARIERCMSNLYPGTMLWFRFINDYIFLKTRDWGTGPKALMGGLICYAVVGRLPAQIEEQSEIAELIYRCAPHIDRGRLGPDTETVCECAREIFSIIHDFLESYAPPPLPATLGSPKPEKAPEGKLDPRRKPSLPKREQPEEKPEMRDEPDATCGDGEPGDNPEEAPDTKDYETWDHTDNKEHDEEKPKDEPGRESVDDGTGENADNSRSGVDSPGKPEPGDDESEPDESTDETEDDPEAGFDGEETGGKTGEDDEKTEPGYKAKGDGEETEPGGEAGEDDDDSDEPESAPDDDTDNDLPHKSDPDDQSHDDLPEDEPDGGLPKDDSGDDPDEVPDDDLLEGNPDDDLDDDLPEDDNLDESGEDEYIGDSGDDSIDLGEYAELVNEAGEELSTIESSSSRAEKAEAKMVIPDIDPENITGELSRDIHRGCEFVLEKDLKITDHSREIYEQIYSNVRPHINKTTEEIRKILEYKTTYLERNLRKGKVHGNSLWKLHVKDPRVFCKTSEPNDIPKLAVYLLVDCSGSMTGKNIAEARKSACLLYETCSSALIKIPVNITGFTSEIRVINDVVHKRFISFDDPYDKRYSIAGIAARHQNRDGYSIRVATRELLLRPEQQKVLIVLSDGMPVAAYLEYRGKTGIRDTALAVREAERQGLGVIGLYFGSPAYLPQAQKIYNNCIYVSNVSVLPQVIGRVLKKVVSSL